MIHREVRLVGTVHAEHAQMLAIGHWIPAQSHQGRGAGIAGHLDEFSQQRRSPRTGIDDTTTGIEDRALGLGDHLNGFFDPLVFRLIARLVGTVDDLFRGDILAIGELHILRQINHDRAGTTGAGNVERLMHGPGKIIWVLDQIIMLGTGAGNAGGIALLERVIADQMGWHLTGQAD